MSDENEGQEVEEENGQEAGPEENGNGENGDNGDNGEAEAEAAPKLPKAAKGMMNAIVTAANLTVPDEGSITGLRRLGKDAAFSAPAAFVKEMVKAGHAKKA